MNSCDPQPRSVSHGGHSERAALGTVCLVLGAIGLLLSAWNALDTLPAGLGRFWVRSGSLLWGLSAGGVLAGTAMLWSGGHRQTRWRPRVEGRRFQSGVLYTRRDCPLCDEAQEVLAKYRRYLPDFVEADIDTDAALRERFNDCVPVVELDGRVRFKGRISTPLLRRLIDSTPPREEGRRIRMGR